MLGKSVHQEQKNLFQPLLKEFINLNHELVLLSEKINWKELENEFSSLYSKTGTPIHAGAVNEWVVNFKTTVQFRR